MKERPILFSAPMVRALLAGTKTQTRRAMRVQPSDEAAVTVEHFHQTVVDRYGDEQPGPEVFGAWWDDGESGLVCPYGQPGDRLWVRENGWQRPERTPQMMREGADTWAPYYFDADGISEQEAADFKAWGFKRRPSIHMPRAASRISLEVTGVRVERLHQISDADCVAEGCPGGHGSIPGYQYNATPREHYRAVWAAVNGPGSWQANPWLWVVEFRRHA
ncbi:hypothetical protein GCM10028796_17470 [Ramlibacter monticola]|uniref:Morphogenetic protein n=1 Tax=Ramlibacter monticola TaxID=1926872 RepID=A0A937CSZ9_9BURK|nr:hypothetical protein [Ramlibacter monticola]MBL0390572.1 hypothetical protein [Ramlibacter monticola]